MSLTDPIYDVNTTISATDIRTGASVYTYTASANRRIRIEVTLTVAGGGEYSAWVTKQWAGTGLHHPVLPKTLITPPGTDLGFFSDTYDVKAGDVVNIWVDGLSGDQAVTGAIRITAENQSVLEAGDVLDEPLGTHTGWLTKLLSVVKFLGLK